MEMKRRQREAVLLALGNALREHGSWCGETHLQKATYFLQELAGVPLETHFILYKHGPFSFELRDELTSMRADGLLEMQIQPPPYGPSFVLGDGGKKLMERWPKTLKRYKDVIEFVAQNLGPLGVSELERWATALYVTKKQSGKSIDDRARCIHALKPHVSVEDAKAAVAIADKMAKICPGTAA